MALNIKQFVSAVRERIENLLRIQGRWLAADDQTRLSWAKPVKTYAEVPEIYRSFFDELPAEEKDPLPVTVLTPTFTGFIKAENEKLVCLAGGKIHVLEMRENKLHTISYPLNGIHYIETGTILLSSWLTINGLDTRGALTASTLKFNSITEHLFAPFVDSFRSTVAAGGKNAGPEVEVAAFDALQETNFKFMSYARRSIQPGEKVIQAVLQPEIRENILKVFTLSFSRLATPAHLSILTDRELILIRDDASQRWLTHNPNGGIWYYIPLNKIASVSLAGAQEDLWKLTIRLPKDQHLECLFQSALKEEVKKLTGQIQAAIDG